MDHLPVCTASLLSSSSGFHLLLPTLIKTTTYMAFSYKYTQHLLPSDYSSNRAHAWAKRKLFCQLGRTTNCAHCMARRFCCLLDNASRVLDNAHRVLH